MLAVVLCSRQSRKKSLLATPISAHIIAAMQRMFTFVHKQIEKLYLRSLLCVLEKTAL